MSRRESRVSMSARQNDALFEFESFKKKFLLANKHITKLNSSLAMRIEELNAQISTLYTENLRLRASEINLAAQLKREREKSRKVIAETEAAALGLTKHMSFLRQAFCIAEAPSSSSSPSPPRATQRPLPSAESPNSPVYPRLSRPPTISQIYEDEEPSDPTEDDDQVKERSPSPRRKSKTKRLSASRLPLPARISSPPPIDYPTPGFSKRKPLRRQSGLLARQDSPVLGSPEVEEEDDLAAFDEQGDEEEEPPVVKKEKRKVAKDKGKEKEHDVSLRKKLRDEMGNEGKKFKLADVTNSPRSRPAQSADPVVSEIELEVAHSSHSRREFLSSSPPRPSTSFRSGSTSYLPTPHNSSSPPEIPSLKPSMDDPVPEPEPAPTGGRERRVRKSVNYAEPKLNTKMRNPDSEPGSRKRKSASAIMSSRSEKRIEVSEADRENDDTDAGARSSLEGPAPGQSSRAKHRTVATGPDPTQLPLPASRPGSSADAAPPSSTILPPRQSKSKSQSRAYLNLYAEDDASSESDGADTEYVPSSVTGKGGSSWVTDRRRGGKATTSKHDDEALRRHSLAV